MFNAMVEQIIEKHAGLVIERQRYTAIAMEKIPNLHKSSK
jgi:hypothetical protein